MIKERIAELVEDLELFDQDIEKYEYIVDLGKKLRPLSADLQKDEFLVQGCTSKVWLISEYIDGKIIYKADSNSVIVKGLISILVSIFQELTPDQILDYDIKGLEDLGLTEIISPTRQNGVFHMVEKIRHYAKVYGG
ncbi:MAG: SufE family protein [Spirochaetaceae bacterium]